MKQHTKDATHALDNSVFHEILAIKPPPWTKGDIDAINVKVKHGSLYVFVRITVLIARILFIVNRVVGGMVADVIA